MRDISFVFQQVSCIGSVDDLLDLVIDYFKITDLFLDLTQQNWPLDGGFVEKSEQQLKKKLRTLLNKTEKYLFLKNEGCEIWSIEINLSI